ncbi:NUDIX hydrolase [Corynebacterium kozikiae]|uniref:NUDIX hydrolase n=1 Tax=Corynebacterium kozikiae TaxID=2968469 RepID=UPI00211D0377|nr:CoA pyrophosphatase [Corynebacterium sp. 76QC2CO]MCQ9342727.1 CoA pyrophosphatase [Corynebacterium sp. 76QC2CO]
MTARHDSPGANIELLPQRAPVWMHKLLMSTHSGAVDRAVGFNLRRPHEPMKDRQAAVLVLLSGTETSAELPNDAAVLLTHRSPTMRSHSGQIAFPGGRMDATDANVVDCALREAWEETGLDRMTVTPVAQLSEVHIRATGYPVTPVLAHWHSISPTGVVSPEEADEVINVPMATLIDPANRFMVRLGQWYGPAFHVNGYVVWGFTGGILDALIEQAGWEQPWDKQTHYDLAESLERSRNNEKKL